MENAAKLKEDERLMLEEQARQTKDELWRLEHERQLLEAESQKAKQAMDHFDETERRKEAELERQRLILLYGDPDKNNEQETVPQLIPTIPPRNTKPVVGKAAIGIKIVGGEVLNKPSNLRVVHIPTEISTKFLSLTAENNKQNIETCGLLFGISEGDAFIITHCMLPKQTGTHDSCCTTNEEQIWKFQGQYISI